MLKYYFLAGALALMVAQAYYINIKSAEIKALKQENQLLHATKDNLSRAIDDLKARHEKELQAIKKLDENKTQIIYKIDEVKAKISQNKSDIITKFNKALDEIYPKLD